MKFNTFIILTILITRMYKSEYNTFVTEIFNESSNLETIQSTLSIQFHESFLYEFVNDSLEFPKILNEILEFDIKNLETVLDGLDNIKIIQSLSKLIFKYKEELKQEKNEYVIESDLMENCLKASKNYFKNYNILKFKNDGENAEIMSGEDIDQAVELMRKNIHPFDTEVLKKSLIRINIEIYQIQKPYFLDLLKIIRNPDEVLKYILDKTFKNSQIDMMNDNQEEMIMKLMNLFGTLILRDTAKNHTNRIKSICESIKTNLLTKKTLFKNEFYRELLTSVFQIFTEYFSLDEIEEGLDLLLIAIFGNANSKQRKLSLVVDDIYEYNGLSYLNEQETEIDTGIIIKTLNTIRHISSKNLIKKKDYLKILKIINFILEMEEKNKRVFIIDNYIDLFDIKKKDIENHRAVFESLFNLIISFSADIKIFNVEKKNTLLMNYLIYRQTHKLDLFTTLNVDISHFGAFLQLWVYLHKIEDFVDYNILFLKSKPIETPLILLQERPKYLKFLNHWISLNESFGTYFEFKLLDGKIITKEISNDFYNKAILNNYLI